MEVPAVIASYRSARCGLAPRGTLWVEAVAEDEALESEVLAWLSSVDFRYVHFDFGDVRALSILGDVGGIRSVEWICGWGWLPVPPHAREGAIQMLRDIGGLKASRVLVQLLAHGERLRDMDRNQAFQALEDLVSVRTSEYAEGGRVLVSEEAVALWREVKGQVVGPIAEIMTALEEAPPGDWKAGAVRIQGLIATVHADGLRAFR